MTSKRQISESVHSTLREWFPKQGIKPSVLLEHTRYYWIINGALRNRPIPRGTVLYAGTVLDNLTMAIESVPKDYTLHRHLKIVLAAIIEGDG